MYAFTGRPIRLQSGPVDVLSTYPTQHNPWIDSTDVHV